MNNLYFIFFAIGACLFALIVIYSVIKKKQKKHYLDEKSSPAIDLDEVAQHNDSLSSTTTDSLSKPVAAETGLSDDSLKSSEKVSFTQQIANRVSRKPAVEHHEPTVESDSAVEELQPSSLDQDQSETELKARVDEVSSTVVTELVAKVKNALPIEQHELLTLFRLHDFKFHRDVHIFGLNQLTENWRDIEFELPSARFVELGVSIQLADREGAMTQKELHDFQQMVLEFTTKFDAPFKFSMGIDEAFEQAQALDAIGRRYDSMAVLNVIPKTPQGFRTADIESCARDLMMSSDKKGIFLKTVGQKNQILVLYRLACADGAGHYGVTNRATPIVNNLVMYMNVPSTDKPEKVFEQMVEDANSLATWLDGKVVDQQRRAMTDRAYSVLMQQIVDISNNMQKDGLTPGDAVSKKLF